MAFGVLTVILLSSLAKQWPSSKELQIERKMENAKEFLEISKEESERVSRLTFPPHRVNIDHSFYEYYALRGIRVDRVEPGFVSCTFKVPSRLIDRNGNLASGAVANLVDEMGGALVHVEGLPMNVSVDMSISYLSTAKLDVSPLRRVFSINFLN
ncbi:OLC1v1006158C1 [Oldenlandia corymbosa var. corymbosa]|uniref:OLC1v1006158C1 n=1 Tax=Oldenlandia corymbosa var. corymbosa TaxID=529605 RepID=A0AAV1DIF3_OLDCO|nr:OLC1v1006158C1 [Oldenlandia corymbosa var. corymbosa]